MSPQVRNTLNAWSDRSLLGYYHVSRETLFITLSTEKLVKPLKRRGHHPSTVTCRMSESVIEHLLVGLSSHHRRS